MNKIHLSFTGAAAFVERLRGCLVPSSTVSSGSSSLSECRRTALRPGLRGHARGDAPRVPGWFQFVLLLLGLPGSLPAQVVPPPVIQAVALQDSIQLIWPSVEGQLSVLQTTADATPPVIWSSVNHASSPWTFNPTAGAHYYRVKVILPDNRIVYSVNVVGYVRRVLQPGTNLVANPLHGANNRIGSLFPNCPEGSETALG